MFEEDLTAERVSIAALLSEAAVERAVTALVDRGFEFDSFEILTGSAARSQQISERLKVRSRQPEWFVPSGQEPSALITHYQRIGVPNAVGLATEIQSTLSTGGFILTASVLASRGPEAANLIAAFASPPGGIIKPPPD